MKLTRILAALLALLMLVGSFAACGGPVEEPDTTAPDGTNAATETEGETELTDSLPDDQTTRRTRSSSSAATARAGPRVRSPSRS